MCGVALLCFCHSQRIVHLFDCSQAKLKALQDAPQGSPVRVGCFLRRFSVEWFAVDSDFNSIKVPKSPQRVPPTVKVALLLSAQQHVLLCCIS